ncbi:helix-turn-helix domain-containing protein [Pseudofrankia sp. DC12]|uniref:helix-turn-helix domain-containing protein n=1 Tax=Pseudofrankia sp. DC12 TaxID=683315 RepID=UPI0005F837D3|nr:helix-turn-helix domain-containing protein [Pseudofrankia sp. DC12]
MTGGSPLPAAGTRDAGVGDGLAPAGAGRTRSARAGLTTERQIAYWRRSGLLRPGVNDLAQARTIAALRRAGISVARIRAAADRLRASWPASGGEPGFEPLSGGFGPPDGPSSQEARFAVVAGELFIRHPDGGWEGDRRPGQLVLDGTVPLSGSPDAGMPAPRSPVSGRRPHAAPDREAILRFVSREDARPRPGPSDRGPGLHRRPAAAHE